MATVRVQQLQDHFGDQIAVTWRSFLLRTEPKTSDRDKFVTYTHSWERPAAADPTANFTWPWTGESPGPTSSLPAQIAWKASSMFGPETQDAMHHRLIAAYFTENQDISSWAVLSNLAEECGIDRAAFESRLEENREHLASWVIDEHNAAIQSGVTAVPTVVVGDVFPIPGAQDLDYYIRVIGKYQEHQAAQAD